MSKVGYVGLRPVESAIARNVLRGAAPANMHLRVRARGARGQVEEAHMKTPQSHPFFCCGVPLLKTASSPQPLKSNDCFFLSRDLRREREMEWERGREGERDVERSEGAGQVGLVRSTRLQRSGAACRAPKRPYDHWPQKPHPASRLKKKGTGQPVGPCRCGNHQPLVHAD